MKKTYRFLLIPRPVDRVAHPMAVLRALTIKAFSLRALSSFWQTPGQYLEHQALHALTGRAFVITALWPQVLRARELVVTKQCTNTVYVSYS